MSNQTIKMNTSLVNYKRAVESLTETASRDLNDSVIVAGLIKNFEFSYELGWIALKRYLGDQGHLVSTAREAVSTSYQMGILSDEKLWLEMIKDRNKTVHTYDKEFAKSMVQRIVGDYLPEFKKLVAKLS